MNTESARDLINFAYAKRHGVLITELTPDSAVIAYRGKVKTVILQELQRRLQRSLSFTTLSDDAFESMLTKTYSSNDSALKMADDLSGHADLQALMQDIPKNQDLLDMQDDAPVIHFLNALLMQAIKEKASDIHIEPFEEKLLIRFRVDGVLREILQPQRTLAPLIISRIKVMAKLDIAEKRIPLDGRMTLRIGGRAVDVRVSTLPSSYGERIVLRLLDKQSAHLNLSSLGLSPDALVCLRKIISKPHGIVLVTGPTGSGKTTTLYAALTELNDARRNILTVEDPVEYHLEGIGQTQVNTKVDMTFARGLRAILRQDPDIVMVGEIRDLETAQIAVQASLTGHLVLSTLHTNSAIGAITRLRDMGIEPFLLSSSLIGIIAQRLIRLLCAHCKKAVTATPSECALLEVDPQHAPQIFHAVGCEACRKSGYQGRSGVYEIVEVDEALRNKIHENASEHDMKTLSRKTQRSIRQDGYQRILAGDTTIEEILRVTSDE